MAKFHAAVNSDSRVLSQNRVIWHWDIEANYWLNKNPAAKPDAQNQNGNTHGDGYNPSTGHVF